MGMNWGGFAGGIAQGWDRGTKIGNDIRSAMKQHQIAKVREQGIAEAAAARQADIDAAVKDNGAPDAQAMAQQTQAAAPAPQQTAQPDPVPAPVQAGPAGAEAATHDRMTPPELQAATAPATAPAPAAEPVAATGMPADLAPKTASPVPPPPGKRYSVGGRDFDDIEAAKKHAETIIPSIVDYQVKTIAPAMQKVYMEEGDIEKAEAWGKWAKDKASERHMETWSRAKIAADFGDFEEAAVHLGKLFKEYKNGVQVEKSETVKDESGNVTGFNLILKDERSGQTRKQFVDPPTLVRMGLPALAPNKMFEMEYNEQKAAAQTAAKARIDAQNDARTAARQEAADIRKETRAEAADIRKEQREAKNAERQQGYKLEELVTRQELEEAGIGRQERAKVQAKIDILKENGLSPDAVRELIPHMVGGDGYKKSTAPEEARRLLLTERVKDPLFARKSQAEQQKIIDQDMATIYSTARPAAPAANGGAPAAAPQGGKKGTPYLTPGGKVEYR